MSFEIVVCQNGDHFVQGDELIKASIQGFLQYAISW